MQRFSKDSKGGPSWSPLVQLRAAFSCLSGLQFTTRELLAMLFRQAPWAVALLLVFTTLGGFMPYLVWMGYGKLVDTMARGPNLTATALVLFLGYALFAKLFTFATQLARDTVDKRSRELFAPFFPAQRLSYGMPGFQAGHPHYEALSRGERAEYNLRFFVPALFQIIAQAIGVGFGAVAVFTHAPDLGRVLLVAVAVTLFVGLNASVRYALVEKQQWRDMGEVTITQKLFQSKEPLKAMMLSGLPRALIAHLTALSQKTYGKLRAVTREMAPLQLIATLTMWGALAWSAYVLVQRHADQVALGLAPSVGTVAFLLATIRSLQVTLETMIADLGKQALGADEVRDMLRFHKELQQANKASIPRPPLSLTAPAGVRAVNLRFTYPGREDPTLQDISFEIPAGNETYVIGANGTGKTTFFNALSVLYPVERGQLFVGDVDVTSVDPDSLREVVRHLAQAPIQFRFSVRKCLAFAAGMNPAESDETLRSTHERVMWRALELACLADQVRGFKRGLDEELGSHRGAEEDLSGGQHKRLNLAMFFMAVLVGNTRLLVLDEPFTSIDGQTARQIEANIEALRRELGLTVLHCTHAVERLRNDVEVLYFYRDDSGRTRVVRGSHGDLLRDNPGYRAFCGIAPQGALT